MGTECSRSDRVRVAARQLPGFLCLLSLLLASATGMPGAAASPGTVELKPEHVVKGAMLAKFPLFVDWPERAFAGDAAPIVIGILGEDPFGSDYDQALANQKVGGRSFEVRRLEGVTEAAGCHVLYVAGSEAGRVAEILAWTEGKPVVVVGDLPGFVEAGATIGFVKESGRVRFQVNLAAARRSGLVLGSQLLKVASKIVQAQPQNRAESQEGEP